MYALVIVVLLVVAVGLMAWSGFREDESGTPAEPAEIGTGPGRSRPTTLEGVLADQLIRGEISRLQYHHAVERLAVRDHQVHPLTVPE